MKFQIPISKNCQLADVFEIIEKRKGELQVKEYSVSQTSLEQIFIHFARQQDEERGVAKGYQGTEGLSATSDPQAHTSV